MTQEPRDDAVAGGRAEAKNPFELALDFGVFAPLGFVLEFRRVVPELARAGRRQIAFSQSLGRAALNSVSRAMAAEKPQPAPAAATAGVVGYDELTARDVVAALKAGDERQAEWIANREAQGKARVTILRAAEQRLQPS